MRIAIIGTGNAGSITLLQLIANNFEHEIIVLDEHQGLAISALLDAGGAYPRHAQRAKIGKPEDVRSCDLVVVCAGVQMGPTDSPKSVLERNAAIVRDYLSIGLKTDACIVVIATPVDDLTAILAESGAFANNRVIGFGGDLDTARLQYLLGQKTTEDVSSAVCIGEHGERTVPIYQPETDYFEVARNVREVVKRITSEAGRPRNLSTGIWLSRLITTLTLQDDSQHVVCGFVPEYGLYLTWPRMINVEGIGRTVDIKPGTVAAGVLASLVEEKRAERPELMSLSTRLFGRRNL